MSQDEPARADELSAPGRPVSPSGARGVEPVRARMEPSMALSLRTSAVRAQARAVANRTDACFIRVIGSELVQKYVGEGARMVRTARTYRVNVPYERTVRTYRVAVPYERTV